MTAQPIHDTDSTPRPRPGPPFRALTVAPTLEMRGPKPTQPAAPPKPTPPRPAPKRVVSAAERARLAEKLRALPDYSRARGVYEATKHRRMRRRGWDEITLPPNRDGTRRQLKDDEDGRVGTRARRIGTRTGARIRAAKAIASLRHDALTDVDRIHLTRFVDRAAQALAYYTGRSVEAARADLEDAADDQVTAAGNRLLFGGRPPHAGYVW